MDELRKLIGLVCDNCGCLAELGTGTTDPLAVVCRFLCGTCAVEIRRVISTASRRTKATNRSPAAALALSAATHWWADRRIQLEAVADATGNFYTLGGPLGGAYALDQAFHHTVETVAVVIGASER
ncbi:hypothetical protein ACIHJG_35600 [Streptomyces sp. NPDC052415]|uniref:hypothetical protein n=1 Tax=Streptomyces sp. NPDC052415 TaxID=3365690 RepID=UPI0037D51C5A